MTMPDEIFAGKMLEGFYKGSHTWADTSCSFHDSVSYTRTSILEAERAAAQERERELLAVIADMDSTLKYYEERDGGHEAHVIRTCHITIIDQARAAKGGV